MTIRGQNVWTEDQRIVLHLLHRDFTFDEATKASLFNHIFAAYLKSSGVTKRITADILSSTYADRNRPPRNKHWAAVFRTPISDADRAKHLYAHQRIREAAKGLGFEVTERSSPILSSTGNVPAIGKPTVIRSPNSTSDEISAQPLRLEMIHRRYIRWEDNMAFLDFVEDAHVDQRSPTYLHGGQVHRVSIPENQDIDCMICDESIDSEPLENTRGLPFVHSSDTVRKNGLTVFAPTPKAHKSVPPRCFRRIIHFQTSSGIITSAALICDYVQCAICSGSEYIRVQENSASTRVADE